MEEVKIQNDNKYLGTEKVGKLLKMFSIPCVLSLVIQALYNLVDQIFIGHSPSLGAIGNAATGIVYPITVIALAIGLWLGDGAAASISLNQGMNNSSSSKRIVGNAIILGVISSLLLTIIMFVFKEQILSFIGATGNVLTSSMEYSTFIFAGLFFYILSSLISPIIRADGSPKYSLIAMAVGCILNIILDPIFIYVLNMGMTGAAFATFIGQVTSFLFCFVYLFKTKTFKLGFKDFVKFDKKLIKSILKLGISSFLTQFAIVIISIVNNMILMAYSVSSGYDVSVTQGALTLAFKVFGIVVSIAIGIGVGGQPILGYNYGAGKYDRVKQTLKYMLIATSIVGLIAVILFEFCPQIFLFIFGDGGEGVDTVSYRNFTILTFRIYLSTILLTCLIKVSSIFFQAIGKPISSTIITMSRDVVFNVPAAIILSKYFGVKGFLFCAPISDVISSIICIVFVVKTVKKLSIKEETKDEYIIKDSKEGIIVTIARQHGSRGRAIGEKLASMLNVPFYDKELTSLVATKSGLSKEYVNEVEEGNVMISKDVYLSLDPSDDARKAQKEVLFEIAKHGSSVIVGRCADSILDGSYQLFKVFISAPVDYRVSQVMESYGDDEKQAKKNIEKSDRKRKDYYEMISGHAWGDPKYYDLCINSKIGIDESASVIYNYLEEAKLV